MPAASSVLLKGRDAAGEKGQAHEKRLSTNCLMKLLVAKKVCLLVAKDTVSLHTGTHIM